MSDAIDKKELKNEYSANIVEEESILKKLVRTSLVVVATSASMRAIGNRKNIDVLKNKWVTSAITGAAAIALSGDNDYITDVGVLGLVASIGYSKDIAKNMTNFSNIKDYESVYRKFKKADDIYKGISLFTVNAKDSVKEVFKNTFFETMNDLGNSDSESRLGLGKELVFGYSKKIFKNTFGAAYNEISSNGLKEGTKNIFQRIIETEAYNEYKQTGADLFDYGSIDNLLKSNTKVLGFDDADLTDPSIREKINKFIKYRQIEKRTTFLDMVGRYSFYDEKTKKVKANISRIFEDEANFLEPLQILANSYYSNVKNKNEVSETGFVDYLNNNGFENVVKKYYNKKNYIKCGEVQEMFTGEFSNLKDQIKDHIYYGKLTNSLDSIYESNIVNGFDKNASDLIKNFAFTNVVKIKNKRIIDETAFDGFNIGMGVASIFENVGSGHYKRPLQKALNVWNPFKLIQSEARIKNNIHNNLMKFTESNGVIINEGAGTFVINREVENVLGHRTSSELYRTNTRSLKVDFKKTSKDIIDENFAVSKQNAKQDFSLKEIFSPLLKFDLKETLEKFSYSKYNPFAVRYNNGKGTSGFKFISNEDGAFKEGSIFNDIYAFKNNRNISKKEVKNDNAVLEKLFSVFKDNTALVIAEDDMIDAKKIIQEHIINGTLEEIQSYKNVAKVPEDKKTAFGKIASEYEKLVKNFVNENDDQFNKRLGKINDLYTKYGYEMPEEYENYVYEMLKRSKEIKDADTDAIAKKISSGDEIISFDLFKEHVNVAYHKKIKNTKDANEKAELTEEMTEYIKRINVSSEYSKIKDKSKDIIYNKTSNKYKLMKNTLIDYLNYEDLEDDKSIAKSAYEQVLNYEYFKLFKKNEEILKPNFESTSKELMKFYSDSLKQIQQNKKIIDEYVSSGKAKEESQLLKQLEKIIPSLQDEDQKAQYGNVYNQLYQKIKKIMHVQNEINQEDNYSDELSLFKRFYAKNKYPNLSKNKYTAFLSEAMYNIEEDQNIFKLNSFDKYEEQIKKISKTLAKTADNEYQYEQTLYNNSYDIFKLNDLYKRTFFDTRQSTNYSTKQIVSSSFERAMETRGKLDSIYNFIFGTVEATNGKYKNDFFIKKNYSDALDAYHEYAEHSNLFSEMVSIKSSSIKPENIVSTSTLATKTIFSKFQDAAEIIGIERLTQNELGKDSAEVFKNIFKYRVLPLAGLLTGAIAVDSFSDLITPDDTPIIGGGISGAIAQNYARTRIGIQQILKYTGGLSLLREINDDVPNLIDNGLTHFFDPLMDPEEMKDVYLNGKPIEIRKNRNWFTAGRQSGEGEEFGQYRPHLLYIAGHKSPGIYDNKLVKFFRQDFLPTKYPWYLLDPYKEERDAYRNFGLVHPKTEQLFKDMPIIGHALSATIGEIIKPTQYIGEEYWRVGENLMKNPNYDPNDPSSPKYIEFKEPNRIIRSVFEGIEDLKTFAGLPGYSVTKLTELMFGKSNPYQDAVMLSSLDQDTSYYRGYEKLQLGGMFGTTEPIRRLLDDGDALGTIKINPLPQKNAKWIPKYFSKGTNLYSSLDFGEYILPGKMFDNSNANNVENIDLKKLRILSIISPKSKEYKELNENIFNNLDTLNSNEKEYFYETLGFASEYGKRNFVNKYNFFSHSKEQEIKIKKKLSFNEFIGADNRRYKISTLSDDFNKLSSRIGADEATKAIDKINKELQVGKTYTFNVSTKAEGTVMTDENGEYINVDLPSLVKKGLITEENNYRNPYKGIISTGAKFTLGLYLKKNLIGPSTMPFEKIFGRRSAYEEWSNEAVQAPYFRDWDKPVSSFLLPYYTYSSNSMFSFKAFSDEANEAFYNGRSDTNLAGTLALFGAMVKPINAITGNVSTSLEYKQETEIQDDIEKTKFIAGDKSFYNITGKETLHQFKKMLNEQDRDFFEGLVNTANKDERKKILKTANPRTRKILETIWSRQEAYLNNEKFEYENEFPNKMEIPVTGAFLGNQDELKNILKSQRHISLSKLDQKRLAIINSYRGRASQQQGDYIANRMYGFYNVKPYISSTISPQGNINITSTNRRGNNY